MRVCAVDHDFLHEKGFGLESISGPNVTKVQSNLFTVAVFLMAKLVARECQDDEAIAEALNQLVHLQKSENKDNFEAIWCHRQTTVAAPHMTPIPSLSTNCHQYRVPYVYR